MGLARGVEWGWLGAWNGAGLGRGRLARGVE